MNTSESIKEIANALNKAQGEMGGVKKASTVSTNKFSYNYADLSSVIEVLKEPFYNNGLSYTQAPIFESGLVGVETLLMHVSGEFISSVLMLPMTKQDPQAAGSAITYARRYSLQSLAGIPSEDDDSQAAMPSDNQPQQNQTDDKPWFNDYQKLESKMLEKIAAGSTPAIILAALRENYKVSKEVSFQIMKLKEGESH